LKSGRRTAVAALPTAPEQEELESFFRRLVQIGVLGVVLTVAAAWLTAHRLLAPLARLADGAERISAGELDQRVGDPRYHHEIAQVANAIDAMLGRLEEAFARQQRFVHDASHELRTPLTSVQGTLELLEEDLRDGRLDTRDAQEQLAAAQTQMRRLARLANELLDLSRLDAQVALRSEPVELGELSRAVAAEFGIQAREHGVEIVVEPPPGPCWAAGDPGAVARVVRILLDNALRYSPPGRPVRVVPAYHGEQATVEICDEGPGVAGDDRELVFERFQRGSAPSGAGGFGLGLAIGRELAERMGGALDLLPQREGEGARFRLSLRIELPAGSHPAADEAPEVAVQPQV